VSREVEVTNNRLTLEGFGLPDNETALLADAGSAKILGPVQAWSFSRKVSLSPGVVGCVDVFVIGQAAMDLRNGVLEFKNACRAGIRICESGEFQNCGDMALILCAQVARVLVVAEVIFTIRQLQSALQQIGGIVLRIIEARSDPESKKIRGVKVSVIERVHVGAQGFTQGARQFSLVMDGSYRFQVRAERGEAFRFDGGLVHVGVVEVSNFAGARACGRVGLGDLLDQVGCALIAEVRKLRKDVDLGAIRRNFSAFDPFAIGVLIKIVTRLDRAIHVGDGDAVCLWRGCILRGGGESAGSDAGCCEKFKD
jgi:hypothetical protein